MTGSPDEPSQNVIPTEDPKGSSGGICGHQCERVTDHSADSSTRPSASLGMTRWRTGFGGPRRMTAPQAALRRRARARVDGPDERSRSEGRSRVTVAAIADGGGRASGLGHGLDERGGSAARAEYRSADPNHGRALGDGDLEVVAHAHRKLAKRAAHFVLEPIPKLTELPKPGSRRFRVL